MPVFYSNDAFSKITGYKRDEVLGKDRRILRGPNTSREATDYIGKAIASLKEIDIEATFHKKDGSSFFCNMIATPIFDEFGYIKYYLTTEAGREMAEANKRFCQSENKGGTDCAGRRCNTIFVSKSTTDIHYLDSSLLSSCLQIDTIVSQKAAESVDEDEELELF